MRLKFLQMLGEKIDLLLLDEPTNHLDIPTREAIETMLQEYSGAIILISHDQYFVEQVSVDQEWKIHDKKLFID